MGCPCCGYGDEPEYVDARTDEEKRRDFDALPAHTKRLLMETVRLFKRSVEMHRKIYQVNRDDLRIVGTDIGSPSISRITRG